MKKVVLFFVAIAATMSAFAQSPVGTFSVTPKVGINFSNLTGNEFDQVYESNLLGDLEASCHYRLGFVVGAEADYQVANRFAVSAGLLYSMQGWERGSSLEVEGTDTKLEDNTKLALGYLNVPILANLYLFKGFAIKAGVQPGFLLSSKLKNDVTGKGLAVGLDNHKDEDVKDGCKTFDFSIPVGLSYEFSDGLVLDFRYNIGLTDVSETENGKNSVFQVTVGYKLPVFSK